MTALVVLGLGVDPTWSLVLSQVVPSFGLPFAFVPLAWFTSRRTIMGTFTNGAGMEAVTVIVVVAIVALDVLLGYLSIAG